MHVTLRHARAGDAALLLAWRNDPDVRAASFAQDEVSEREHREWLRAKLGEPGSLLLIVELSGEPVGQVRLDRRTADEAEISISLAPPARRRGVGRAALSLAVGEAATRLGVRLVSARVKEDNERSLHAFEAAGFAETRRSAGVVTLTRAAGQADDGSAATRST